MGMTEQVKLISEEIERILKRQANHICEINSARIAGQHIEEVAVTQRKSFISAATVLGLMFMLNEWKKH